MSANFDRLLNKLRRITNPTQQKIVWRIANPYNKLRRITNPTQQIFYGGLQILIINCVGLQIRRNTDYKSDATKTIS